LTIDSRRAPASIGACHFRGIYYVFTLKVLLQATFRGVIVGSTGEFPAICRARATIDG
jgi:hypothetical protein